MNRNSLNIFIPMVSILYNTDYNTNNDFDETDTIMVYSCLNNLKKKVKTWPSVDRLAQIDPLEFLTQFRSIDVIVGDVIEFVTIHGSFQIHESSFVFTESSMTEQPSILPLTISRLQNIDEETIEKLNTIEIYSIISNIINDSYDNDISWLAEEAIRMRLQLKSSFMMLFKGSAVCSCNQWKLDHIHINGEYTIVYKKTRIRGVTYIHMRGMRRQTKLITAVITRRGKHDHIAIRTLEDSKLKMFNIALDKFVDWYSKIEGDDDKKIGKNGVCRVQYIAAPP